MCDKLKLMLKTKMTPLINRIAPLSCTIACEHLGYGHFQMAHIRLNFANMGAYLILVTINVLFQAFYRPNAVGGAQKLTDIRYA